MSPVEQLLLALGGGNLPPLGAQLSSPSASASPELLAQVEAYLGTPTERGAILPIETMPSGDRRPGLSQAALDILTLLQASQDPFAMGVDPRQSWQNFPPDILDAAAAAPVELSSPGLIVGAARGFDPNLASIFAAQEDPHLRTLFKQMENGGWGPTDIWREIGTFRGPGGHILREIPAGGLSALNYNEPPLRSGQLVNSDGTINTSLSSASTPLNKVLTHPAFDDPSLWRLGETGLTSTTDMLLENDGTLGGFDPNTGDIYILPQIIQELLKGSSPPLFSRNPDVPLLPTYQSYVPENVLIHEMQHAVDAMQGRPAGTNQVSSQVQILKAFDYLLRRDPQEMFARIMDFTPEQISNTGGHPAFPLWDATLGPKLGEGAFNVYQRHPGEILARAAASRDVNLTKAEAAEFVPSMVDDALWNQALPTSPALLAQFWKRFL